MRRRRRLKLAKEIWRDQTNTDPRYFDNCISFVVTGTIVMNDEEYMPIKKHYSKTGKTRFCWEDNSINSGSPDNGVKKRKRGTNICSLFQPE